MFDLEYYRSIKEYKDEGYSNDQCNEYRKKMTSLGMKLEMSNHNLRRLLKKKDILKNEYLKEENLTTYKQYLYGNI